MHCLELHDTFFTILKNSNTKNGVLILYIVYIVLDNVYWLI